MWKMNKIEVLSGIRPILKLSNLYNKNGVTFKYNKKGGSVKIPNFLIFSLITLPTIYLFSLAIWIVIEEKFNLKLISHSLTGAIGLFQVTTAFISLGVKSDLVTKAVDHLQEVVEKSK